MPESPASSVEGSPSTAWPGIFLSLLFGIECGLFLPTAPCSTRSPGGAAPCPPEVKKAWGQAACSLFMRFFQDLFFGILPLAPYY